MADVFISYAREDDGFVRRLHAALETAGRDSWVDWQKIPLTAEFKKEIFSGIESADDFLFVISPDSCASEICLEELDHAVGHNKRLVPVSYCEVDPSSVPERLRELHWVLFRDDNDFDKKFADLLRAIDTDLDWVRAGTRLLVRAIDWQNRDRDASLLLRGQDLVTAEGWLAETGQTPDRNPTPLQSEFILASRKGTTHRRRVTIGVGSVALIIALGLGVFAFYQSSIAEQRRTEAEEQARIAESRRLVAASSSALIRYPQRSLLLAVEAAKVGGICCR
jgi:hypothetical protein